MMATGSNAPDSWEAIDDQSSGVSTDLAKLNVNAKPFVPNVNAPAFVPSFMKTQQLQNPVPTLPAAPAPAESSSQTSSSPSESPKDTEDDNAASWEEQGDPAVEEKSSDDSIEEAKEEVETEEEKPNDTKKNGTVKEDSGKLPKKVDVEEEDKKEHCNVVFIGHVDAGKSTIGGHLMYLTGQVDKRTLEKYEREAKEKNRETWYLSWALDTNLEERDKGKTVETGRAYFDTPSKHFILLDAPGHKSFVPNMISGAAQADLGVLVISARKGEFETGFERGGQTREHAMLIKTAGIKHLVILVNKMDDPTVNWEQERYDEIEKKLNPFLKKVGFRASDMYFMPCSGFTGANLKEPVDPKVCPWYKGASFLDYLDKLPSFQRPYDGPLKILVSDRYKDMGTIVIGKVESGTITRGESYTLMPNKNTVKVMNIIGPDEQEKASCRAGENVKVKLSGVEEEDVLPGFVVCTPDALCSYGRLFDAQVVILEHKSIICPGYGAILHIHNAVEEVTLVGLIATIDKKTGEKSKQRPRFVKQDTVCIARFQTANVICMEPFSKFQPMGRFTLRDEGKTIAIGKVLKLVEKKDKAAA